MIFELLFLSSGLNVIVLALVLIHKRLIPEQGRTNRLFIFLLVCMFSYSVIALMRYFAIHYHLDNLLTYYLPIDDVIFSLVTPALYLFIKSILKKPFKLVSTRTLLHLFPCFIFTLFGIYFILQHPMQRMNFLYKNFHTNYIDFKIFNSLIYLQVISYLFLCYMLIAKQMKVTNILSLSTGSFDISWLKSYILITLIYTVLTIPAYVYFENEEIKIIITQIGIEIQFIYFFIRWVFNTEGTLFKYHIGKKNISKTESDVAALQLCIIETYMKEQKPYLNEKCTIQTVANKTGLTVHQISGIINSSLKKSFTDYINEYRVNDAIGQLLSSKSTSTTIEAISIDCGFGSKSTFNRAFKKFTNLTPTEYMQKHN